MTTHFFERRGWLINYWTTIDTPLHYLPFSLFPSQQGTNTRSIHLFTVQIRKSVKSSWVVGLTLPVSSHLRNEQTVQLITWCLCWKILLFSHWHLKSQWISLTVLAFCFFSDLGLNDAFRSFCFWSLFCIWAHKKPKAAVFFLWKHTVIYQKGTRLYVGTVDTVHLLLFKTCFTPSQH